MRERNLHLSSDVTQSTRLLARSYEVARRFMSLGIYDSEAKAAKVLRRFCKGQFSEGERDEALKEATQLIKVVVKVVELNLEALRFESNRKDLEFEDWYDTQTMAHLVLQVKEQCPKFYFEESQDPTVVYKLAVSWVFFWHHIRGAPVNIHN